jgi:hypothetical protein
MTAKLQELNFEADFRQLSALANLLLIREGDQLDPDATNNFEELGDLTDDASVDTIRTDVLSLAQNESLRKRFLDRIAELFAKDAGGLHVSCTAIRENEKEERVDVWIARNSGIIKADGSIEKPVSDLIAKLKQVLPAASAGNAGKIYI